MWKRKIRKQSYGASFIEYMQSERTAAMSESEAIRWLRKRYPVG
jgi:hypothetical protein